MTAVRTRLFHGTAVAALVVATPGLAASVLPTGGTIASGTVTATGTGATVAGGGTFGAGATTITATPTTTAGALNLKVGTAGGGAGQTAVINWDSFDIGATTVGATTTLNSVNFSGAAGAYSVLNRVTGGALTTIAGAIDGGGNGSIFVINEAGILFKGSATVTNLSGFVASSLNIDLDNDAGAKFAGFAGGANTTIRFAPSVGNPTAGIQIDAGAKITPGGVLLLVAPVQNVAAATLTAGGDAGFVIAADATVKLNPTSLISVAIAKGTDVSTLGASTIGATVSGQHVLLAAASSADITAALLNVGGSITATTVTPTDEGIVLAAGGDSSGTVTFAAPDPGPPVVPGAQFRAGINVTGTLGSGGGRLDATATGRLTLAADVTSGSVLTGTGTDLVLGAATETHTIAAAKGLTLRSTTGDIAASGTLAIKSATDDGGSGTLIIDSAGAISGGASLTGGTTAHPTAIGIRLGAPTQALALGAVTGSAFGSVDYVTAGHPESGYGAIGSLATQGDITTGAVKVGSAIGIASTGGNIVTGALTSGGAVAVSASGTGKSATVAGATATGAANDVTLSADGALDVTGAVGSGRDVVATSNALATVAGTVTAGRNYTVFGTAATAGATAVSVGGSGITQAAAGDILIRGTTGAVSAAGTLTADSGGAGGHRLVLDAGGALGGGAVLNGGAAGQSDVLLVSGGDIALGAVTANQFAGATLIAVPTGAVSDYVPTLAGATPTLVTANAIQLGAVTTGAGNAIRSTGTALGHRDVTVAGDSSSTGSVELASAGGALTVSDTVSAATTASLHADFATAGDADATRGVLSANIVKAFAGDATVLGGRAVTKQDPALDLFIAASGNVTVRSAGSIGFEQALAGGTATVGGLTAGSDAASLTADSVRAGGAVTINTSGAIDLVGLGAGRASAQSTGRALSGDLTTFSGGVVAPADVTVAASSGTVTALDLIATRNVVASATRFILGADGATRKASAGGTVTLTASDTGATALTVLGDYSIAGTGAVLVQHGDGSGAAITQDDSLAIGGSKIVVGDVALAGALPTLFGSGNVALAATGAAGAGAVSAGTVAARNAVTVSSANDAVTLGGAISGSEGAAPHGVTVTAAGNADVVGTVTAAGDYSVVAHGISLADNGATQSAAGNILIRSGSNIFASGTLAADTGGTGTKRLVLDASLGGLFNSGAGPVSLIAGAGATPTAANRSDILLSLAANHALSLGTVDADAFGAATHGLSPTTVADYTLVTSPALPTLTLVPTLVVDGALSTGTIRTVAGLRIGSTGLVPGSHDVSIAGLKTAAGPIEAFSLLGDLTLSGDVAAEAPPATATATGTVDLHADTGTLRVGNVSAYGGTAILDGLLGITATAGTAVAALTDVVLASDGTIGVAAVRAGGNLTVGGLSVLAANLFTAGSVQSAGSIALTTLGDIGSAGTPVSFTAQRRAIDPTLGGFTGGLLGTHPTIALTSTTGAVFANALTAGGDISVKAATTASVAGAVDAGNTIAHGNYTVTGATVSLGAATQKATGDVWIRATGAGGIDTAAALQADDLGTGGSRLVLDSAGAIGGGGSLSGGTAENSAVLIRLADTTKAVTLGAIDASSLALATTTVSPPVSVASYTPVVTGQFETAGAVTLGAVKTAAANVIGSTGVGAGSRDVVLGGDVSTGGSVEVRSATGAVTVNGAVSGSNVDLHADDAANGVLTVGDVTTTGSITLIGGQRIVLPGGPHTLAAINDVTVKTAGAVTLDAVRAGGQITIAGVTAGTSVAAFTAGSVQSNAATTISATGAVRLTDAATPSGTLRNRIDANLGGFHGPATAPDADFVLASTGGGVSAQALTSTGSLTLMAGGPGTAAAAAGTVTAGDAATAAGSGNFSVRGDNILLGGGGVVQSATGGIILTSDGAIVADTLRAAGAITVAGATVGTSPVSFTGAALQSNAAVAVTTTGTLTLTGTGGARSGTFRQRFDPTARTFSGPGTVADAAVMLTSGTVTIADAATTGNLTLAATGLASATGTVDVGDAATAAGGGSYVVSGGSIMLGGVQTANGGIDLRSAGAIGVGSLRSGGAINASGPGVTAAGSFTGIGLQASAPITVTTTGLLQLTGAGATQTATERLAFDPTTRGFSGAAVGDHNLTLTARSGAVNAVDLASTGDLAVSAGGQANIAGIVAVGDAADTTGAYTVAADNIVLGGGAAGQAALGDITLASPGAVVVGGLRSGGAIAVHGATAGQAAASLAGDSLRANGGVAVLTGGDIQLTGIDATALATPRQRLNAGLTAFTGAPVADAGATLTSTGGNITLAGGTTTGQLSLSAAAGTIDANGLTRAGDAQTLADGTITLSAGGRASLVDGGATQAISVTSTGGDAVIGTALAGTGTGGGGITATSLAPGHAATIGSATATGGDVVARATAAGGSATITAATVTGANVLADGDAGATIAAATTLGSGDVTANSASGNAAIGSATAAGSVVAQAAGLADITQAGAGGDVLATGGSAHIGTGMGANVRAVASDATAAIDAGTAIGGDVTARAATDATITSGSAALGSVRATAGGLATITGATAGQSVVADGARVTAGAIIAGDDIILLASAGNVAATQLDVTGAGSDIAALDAAGATPTFAGSAVTGLGGSNVIVRASGTAAITGHVAVAQANAAKTANFDVAAGAITLGQAGAALDQSAAGRIDLAAGSGDVALLGSGGGLISNVGGRRTANTLADGATAGGGLTIDARGNVAGAAMTLTASQKRVGGVADTQASQPGVSVASAAAGGGSVKLAAIDGGAINVTAPATIAVPQVTATGAVTLRGTAVIGNDTATVAPTVVTIDGLNAGYAPVAVTLAGGAGAELTALNVVNGGRVGALQLLSDTGAATLRTTPADPAATGSILVELQTGVAGILGGSPVAAGQIVLRGRQAGSSVLATAPLLATGSILATGPTVTIGSATVAGTAGDGPGDILIAASTAASLAANPGETAVARRTINLAGGTVLLGDGTATGGTLAISGSDVTIARRAVAGDDLAIASLGGVSAPTATLTTTGAADLQAGNDAAQLGIIALTSTPGSGYGAGHSVITDTTVAAVDAASGNPLTRLAGANVAVTAAGNIDLAGATLTAGPGTLQRDIHIEAGGTLALATTTATRDLVATAGGDVVLTGALTTGDDLVVGSNAAIDASAATLRLAGTAGDETAARRADGVILASAAGGGSLTALGGRNIALTAGGPVTLGAVAATGAAPAALRAFSLGTVTTTQAISVNGGITLVGAAVAAPFALTAGDDVVAVARGGAATLGGAVTTTGAAATSVPLVDLAGGSIALPGEAALGRVEGASVLVAATGVATVSDTVTSAGRYTVIGRGGVSLGTAGATLQGAAGDVLIAASAGIAPASASVTLADGLVLASNSDGVEATRAGGFVAEPLVIAIGNGDLIGGNATLRAGRTAAATLGDQGTVQVVAAAPGGLHSVALALLDSASADLRAQGDVAIGQANIDAGLTLASAAGAVSLPTLTLGTGVPLMTAAETAAIDVKLSAATGATLGTVGGAPLVRDITVATSGGTASLTTASARDDIVVTSAAGQAVAGTLTFAGAASDAQGGNATIAATDANGTPLADPYRLSGTTITGLAGRTIVVAGAAGASLDTVVTSVSDGLGDVRVLADTGPATLTTVATGGAGLPARVIVASRSGTATGTTLAAAGDIIVAAGSGAAVVGTGDAGRDAVVTGATVTIDTLRAGDDIVAVASGGTLTATTLTSTGANSGDGVATIAGADGTAIADPVAGGTVGGLAGGNVVALASGDVNVTTATATALPGVTAPGLVRLASLGTTTVTGATASAGDVIAAGAVVRGGTLTAGRDATVTASGGDVAFGTIASGRDLAVTAANDATIAGATTAGGAATLVAARDLNLGATAAGDALDTGGSATLSAGRDIVIARPVGIGLAFTATAGGAATLAGFASGGATAITTGGDFSSSADGSASGTLAVTSTGGVITATGLAGNGITLASAGATTVAGATMSTAALTATGGSLGFGTVTTNGDATLHGVGGVTLGGGAAIGGALAATSDHGAIQTAAVTTGGPATFTAADATGGTITLASLSTNGAATLSAGRSATVGGLARTTGALTATATNGSLEFGAIDAGGNATLRSQIGLDVAGLAKSAAVFDARSTAGAVTLGSVQAASATVRGASLAVAGNTTSPGAVMLTADSGALTTGDVAGGAVTVAATAGSATLASVSRATTLTVSSGAGTTIAGDIAATGDVAITAGGAASLGSVSGAAKLTVTAASDAAIAGAIATTGDTTVTATGGSATLGGTVRAANYTVKAASGSINLGASGTPVQLSSGTVTLDSQRLVLGAGLTLVGQTRIQLDVTGNAAGVSLGDGPGAAAGASRYGLTTANLRALQTPILEIAAAALPVDIGAVNLDGVAPVAGGVAGVTGAFGIRTTGDIRVADQLTFTSAAAGTPRVLTLGGAAGGADLDKTTASARSIAVLAAPGLDNTASGTGGQINATGTTVQLRASYIALGETPSPLAGRPFIDALLPGGGTALTTATVKTQYVDNATSTLYVALPPYARQTPAPPAIVRAGTLLLAPGQWALIQNTGPTTTPGGGIQISTLKFNKLAGAAAPDPEIAVFGSIAGKTGLASAISIDAGNLDGISPNNIRINGCVALSTAGCIQSAVAIPLINLADPGRALLISSAPDLALSVELITGATNEALWREDDDTPGENRPQRESRP